MRRKGFTLIELLVVIAIIAILAAILFPVFARAREKARQATCLSGLKQMTAAMLMYYQDFDELWPQYRNPVPGKDDVRYTWWPEMINPYTKNLDVLFCPSSPYRREKDNYTADFSQGYGYNYYLGRVGDSHASTYEQAIARERPAESLLLVDSNLYIVYCPVANPNLWLDKGFSGTSTTLPTDHPNARYQAVGDWHSDGMNIGFCDGHAKWMKINRNLDRRVEQSLWGH